MFHQKKNWLPISECQIILSCKMKTNIINHLNYLTYREVENKISHLPALLLPIASIEPLGDYCSLGAIQEYTTGLASLITEKSNILQAPMITYSYTTPYSAFAGVLGTKKNIFESTITTIIKQCTLWGIKYIFLLDASTWSVKITKKIKKQYEKHKSIPSISLLHWQDEEPIQSFYKQEQPGIELGRAEYAMVSMVASINPSLIRKDIFNQKRPIYLDSTRYRRWEKTGMDPEKFRKMFPNCTTSNVNKPIDPLFGKKLLEFIAEYFKNIIVRKITV